jgi:hypothetical protein
MAITNAAAQLHEALTAMQRELPRLMNLAAAAGILTQRSMETVSAALETAAIVAAEEKLS